MKDFLEFIEALEQPVDVSDAVSGQLVGMNRRLRQELGLSEETEYLGRGRDQLLDPAREHLSLHRSAELTLQGRDYRLDLLQTPEDALGRDPLTGAYDRTALYHKLGDAAHLSTAGVIFCDITGLKVVNDTLGHKGGDKMLRHCFQLIHDNLSTPWLYRFGGDEFIALYPDVTEDVLLQQISSLREAIQADRNHMAVGWAWSDRAPLDYEPLISQANDMMYEEKRQYYASTWLASIENGCSDTSARGKILSTEATLIDRFAATTYADVSAFLHSISYDNTSSYFYFGDMQKDLFYITDNMREAFGFSSNVVSGLLQDWESRISTEKFRDMYREKLAQMLSSKADTLDMRYQVRRADGQNVWVRSYGVMTWNAERTKPLFFSGRLTHQDDNFLIDPITNFPKEGVALKHLELLHRHVPGCRVMGFSLNNIVDINSTHGRNYGDTLVRRIASDLVEEFSGKLGFYRLEGMRFVVLDDPRDKFELHDAIARIRRVVETNYTAMGVSVRAPVTFAVMSFNPLYPTLEDFLDVMAALINMSRTELNVEYVDDSEVNIQRLKRISNMTLALSRDVMNDMENFRVVVQPLVSSEAGEIVGGETLMRWRFEGEDVSPGIFIPYMEKEGMIAAAGKWVFEQAVRTCLRMLPHHPNFFLTVNISLYQLSDPTFLDFIRETMEKYQLDGRHLIAEMTESCMDQEPEKLIRFVDACGACGIRVALDDFGTGYSSLRVLLQYPSTLIKLDRSLLLEMSTSADKVKFISSLVFACHRFGKKVCMEGVETPAQNELVKQCGCDMIQGFYYHRPTEVPKVEQLLSAAGE